jgi:pyruvate oxidase
MSVTIDKTQVPIGSKHPEKSLSVGISESVGTDKPVNAGMTAPGQTYTAAQFLVEQLLAWGVERIYGVIGDATLQLLDTLAEDGRISYIAAAHEGAAALMASAEAKLTGRMGVCIATSGPGIANLMNGLGDAHMDGASVLAITGQVDTDKIGTQAKQYIDQQRVAEPFTGLTRLLANPLALPEMLLECLTYSTLQGGVSHLSVPKDLWTKKLRGAVSPYMPYMHQPVHAPDDDVRELAEMLAGAERPVLLIGRGIEHVQAELLRLAERLNAAVVTTLPARPYFPNDHELYSGGLGQAGSQASSQLLGEADLIAILGATWWPKEYAPAGTKAKVVQIDATASNIGLGHPVDKGVVGDLRHVLPRVVELVEGLSGTGRVTSPGEDAGSEGKAKAGVVVDASAGTSSPDRSAWRKRVLTVTQEWKRQIEAEADQQGTGSPVKPQCLIRAISRAAAPDAVIAVDTGDHTLWFNRIFQAQPQQRILVSGRWRTLGFALPAAIAAQAAEPRRQVIALAGDGGVVQTIMELGTAVRYGLPVILIVCRNGSYAMEKHRMEQGGLEPLGARLESPDFAAIARACGGEGWQADTPDRLEECLRGALAARKPAVIDVSIDDTPVPHTHI